MEKAAVAAAGEDGIADERDKAAPSSSAVAPSPKKCKTAAVDAGASGAASSVPDDVVRNILARLPARTAVACTALSKHHGGLIRSPRPEQKNPASRFYGFHVAGAGRLSCDGPMRTVAGWRYLGTRCVNTCNGVVLLASNGFSDLCRCTLWNPAVADVAREVTVAQQSPESKCLVLGFGYGRRSKTYKMLLCRKDTHQINRIRITGGPTHRIKYSLVIQLLGDGAEKQIPLPIVSSVEVDEKMKQKSLYLDGTIYLHLEKSVILAFEVDDETVSKIDVPGERQNARLLHGMFELIEMSADHHREQMCVISDKDDIYCLSIVGVWHCGGMLVLHFECSIDDIWLYDVATKKIYKADMPGDLMVQRSDYELAWGYRPTLVSPGSIVGEISQDLERRRNRSAHIMEVTNPLSLQDMRKGQEATLNTVCLMEFLVRIVQNETT
uniref:Uncharacterized protein n=1 Tax=Setaria viridis TaxID=4556 RepID=A0A4U6TYC8_SETVI|nr:hypothetical protein SEVIR_7G230900v2 [Setaria viridis]